MAGLSTLVAFANGVLFPLFLAVSANVADLVAVVAFPSVPSIGIRPVPVGSSARVGSPAGVGATMRGGTTSRRSATRVGSTTRIRSSTARSATGIRTSTRV
jgi:hypothetical protein